MLQNLAAIASSATLAALLTGCAAQHAAAITPRSSNTPGTSATATSAASGPADDEPSIAAGNASASGLVAQAGVGAFCRPRLTASRWIAGLDPLLTLQAASAYATVNPARVRCSRVLAAPVSRAGDAFSQVMSVPTDAGSYRVLLSRASVREPWRISQLTLESTR